MISTKLGHDDFPFAFETRSTTLRNISGENVKPLRFGLSGKRVMSLSMSVNRLVLPIPNFLPHPSPKQREGPRSQPPSSASRSSPKFINHLKAKPDKTSR